jgi:hypothetical protein
MPSDAHLGELRARLAPDRIVDIAPIPSSKLVADETAKYRIATTGGDLFLIVSNETSPLLVKRGADRQREIRGKLHGLAAESIELPIHEGFISDKSYAVWRRRKPLSSSRIWSRIEIRMIAPKIYRWLKDVASQTVTKADVGRLIFGLERLRQVAGLSRLIGIAAAAAADGFRAGDIPALQIVQHSDLWSGNILKAPCKPGFIIIDWAGARLDGAPFFDLINLAISVGASRSKLRTEVMVHSQMLGCDPRHALAYVLSGLGALHLDLEHFPESRFVALCERKFHALQVITST